MAFELPTSTMGTALKMLFKRAPGPIGLGSSMGELAYPFTQDKNFPGVADARHAHAQAVLKAIRDNPQATGTSLDGGPSTLDYLKKGLGFLNDPYGVNKTPTAPMPNVAPPISQSNYAPSTYPQGSDPMTAGGVTPTTSPVLPTQPMPPVQGLDLAPAPYPQGSDPMTAGGVPRAPMASKVPMPQARPAEAPQPAPDMSFFKRNALMMQDPMTGQFIDPAGAAQAQASGPDLIAKMMNYLHSKA